MNENGMAYISIKKNQLSIITGKRKRTKQDEEDEEDEENRNSDIYNKDQNQTTTVTAIDASPVFNQPLAIPQGSLFNWRSVVVNDMNEMLVNTL